MQSDIEGRAWFETGNRDDITARDSLAHGQVRHIDCSARAGLGKIDISSVALYRANSGGQIARLHDDRVPTTQRSAGQCAGHDRADPAQGEGAIDKQSRLADVALRLELRQLLGEHALQLRNPITGRSIIYRKRLMMEKKATEGE